MRIPSPSLKLPHARRARDRVADDLRTLAHDSEVLLAATAQDLGENANRARERLRETIDRIKETVGDWRSEGMASVRHAAERADEAVHAHPYRALGIAFGAGLLVGLLFRRDD